ncbi:UNVERIFIED_ORG: hypothetical protein GGE44_000496 [Rhizobium esperanzae]
MSELVEYSFRIIGTKPSSIPMVRLAVYMAEFGRLLGCQESVHFDKIVDASVGIVALVRPEDVPVVSPRVRDASSGSADADAASHYRKLNEYLGEDGWSAELPLPKGGQVIAFPGAVRSARAIRVVNQHTSVQGRLIRIEGGGDRVKVGLEIDGDLTARISVPSELIRELATLFHQHVRLSGDGRWKRDSDGKWYLDNLNASSFERLDDIPLSEALGRLRNVIPEGAGEKIIKAVDELRSA